MAREQESSESKGDGKPDQGSFWSAAGTRVWLVAASITLAVVVVAGGGIYFRHDQARVRLEAQYSKTAAHFAEEADLRIESYRRVAAVIGGVESWQKSMRPLDARVKANDSAATSKAAKEASSKASEKFGQSAAMAGNASDAQKDASTNWDAARQKEEATRDELRAANEALWKARGDVDRARGFVKAADFGPATKQQPQTDSPRAAQIATETLQSALLRQSQAEARYETATKNVALASAETSAKQRDLLRTTDKEARAFVALQAVAQDAKNAEDLAESIKKKAESDREAERQKLLSFLPLPSDCDDAPKFDECYAQALVDAFFHGQERAVPRVVSCPTAADGVSTDDAPVLIAGRQALFRIPRSQVSQAVDALDKRSTLAVDPSAKEAGLKGEATKDAASQACSVPGASESPKDDLCLRVALDAIVPFSEHATASEADVQNAFGEVLLADGKSCEVLERSSTDPQVRPFTLPGCDSAMAPKLDPPPPGKLGAKDADEKPEPTTGDGATVDIGGERYRAFWQPLRSSFQCKGGRGADAEKGDCGPGRSLVVVGLVHDGRIVDQVRGLSPLVFLFVVALAALALFSWPVAKLWLIGARARFSRFDSSFLATSALAGTFIITLVVMALTARERLSRRLDDQLGAVNTEVTNRLDASMREASEHLDEFVARTKDLRDAMITAKSSGPNDLVVPLPVSKACDDFAAQGQLALKHLYTVQWPHPEDAGHHWPICDVPTAERMTAGNGPQGSTVFWANELGYVQVQQSDAPEWSPPVNVAARDYFRTALEEAIRRPVRDVAEVVRSIHSTKKILVVSRTAVAKGDGSTDQPRPGVVAFETNLYRFENLALPPAVQWAAVDAHGNIMLHSSIDDHHGHNLFDDLDDATANRLHAAILTKNPAPFDGEYRGVRSRFDVHSNFASRWYVVAIGSRGPNEAITRTTLVTAASAYGVFVLSIAILVICLSLYRVASSNRKDRPRLFDPRPRGDSSRVYARVFGQVGAGSSVLLILTLACPWIPSVALLIAVALLLLSSARQLPGVWSRDSRSTTSKGAGAERTWKDRLTLTYALCSFAFAMAFVVVPTTICFVGSFSLAARSALRAEQLLQVPRVDCIKNAGPSCPKSVAHLEPHRGPRDAPDLAPQALAPLFSANMLWPVQPLMAGLQSDYVSAAAQADCPPADSAGHCPKWVDRTPEIRLEGGTEEDWSLSSVVPHLLGHTHYGHLALGAVVVGLLLLGAHAAAYVSLKRLFFLDLLAERAAARSSDRARQARKADPTAPAQSEPERLLYLFPPDDVLTDPAAREPSTVILRAEDRWSAPYGLLARVRDAKRVLAVVDPLRRVPESQREAWAEALRGFVVIRGAGRPRVEADSEDTPNTAVFAHEWAASDEDEQRVLGQLAFDGHASPHPGNIAVLRHLAARGLIDDVTLSIADPAFAQYLVQTIRPEQMETWEGRETDVAWSVVRVPLVTSVGLVIGLVLISHPELAESGALLLPPVAGGLPVVLRFVAMLTGKGKDATA